jgi:hypothetical protein
MLQLTDGSTATTASSDGDMRIPIRASSAADLVKLTQHIPADDTAAKKAAIRSFAQFTKNDGIGALLDAGAIPVIISWIDYAIKHSCQQDFLTAVLNWWGDTSFTYEQFLGTKIPFVVKRMRDECPAVAAMAKDLVTTWARTHNRYKHHQGRNLSGSSAVAVRPARKEIQASTLEPSGKAGAGTLAVTDDTSTIRPAALRAELVGANASCSSTGSLQKSRYDVKSGKEKDVSRIVEELISLSEIVDELCVETCPEADEAPSAQEDAKLAQCDAAPQNQAFNRTGIEDLRALAQAALDPCGGISSEQGMAEGPLNVIDL